MDEVDWPSDDAKARVTGEAKFLRGLSYLRLAELFGGVPLVLEYGETPNYAYDRASRVETYNVAIEDLTAAYAALPWNISAEYGRAGKGAAGMYLAEALLARGVENNDDKADYSNAAKYAQEVIDHHPMMTKRFGVRNIGATGSHYGIPNENAKGNVITDLFVAQNIVSAQNTEAIWIMVSAPDYATFAANGGDFFNPTPGGRRCNTLGLTPALQDYEWATEYKAAGAADGPWKAFSAKYGGAMSPASHGGTGWAQVTPTWYASYTQWDNAHNNNSLGKDLRYLEDVSVITEFMCCDDKHPLYPVSSSRSGTRRLLSTPGTTIPTIPASPGSASSSTSTVPSTPPVPQRSISCWLRPSSAAVTSPVRPLPSTPSAPAPRRTRSPRWTSTPSWTSAAANCCTKSSAGRPSCG